MPGWVTQFLKFRDFLVKPLGLETGSIPPQEKIAPTIRYVIGDRAIFFSVIDRSDSEIVMAENDKHLYFRTSIHVEKTHAPYLDHVYLTTIVQYHNIWGKLYFAPVKPFHKLIMKILLTNLTKSLSSLQK